MTNGTGTDGEPPPAILDRLFELARAVRLSRRVAQFGPNYGHVPRGAGDARVIDLPP